MGDENFQGCGVARRVSGGRQLPDHALKVYVQEKRPVSRLGDALVPRRLTLPDGTVVETDVEAIGRVKPHGASDRVRPFWPGVGISHAAGTTGTLGLLVRRKDDPSALYLLSCAHVLAAEGIGRRGDGIYQPGVDQNPVHGGNAIAVLEEAIPFDYSPYGHNTPADAAIARILERSSAQSALRGRDAPPLGPGTVRRDKRVTIYGVMSSGREGIIKDIDYTPHFCFRHPDRPGLHRVGFRNHIMCGGIGENADRGISKDGDSGAALLDADGRVLGVVCGGSPARTIASRIAPILRLLRIDIVTDKV
ncbi:MAG TPA: hypothetical protein VGN75_03615 [Kaistia sp.]|jgi:hypothetical protein|nr:hypothetical protein [Kaistia sp.]